MRSSLIFVVIGTALSCSVGCSSVKQRPENLDLESTNSLKEPVGWTFTNPDGIYRQDEQIFHNGRCSLQISTKNDSLVAHSAWQDLKAPGKGRSLTYSGFLKTADVNNGDASLYVWVMDRNGNALASLVTRDTTRVYGTRDWQRYSLTVPLPKEAATIRIGVMLYGSGKLWADDLSLSVDDNLYSVIPSPATAVSL